MYFTYIKISLLLAALKRKRNWNKEERQKTNQNEVNNYFKIRNVLNAITLSCVWTTIDQIEKNSLDKLWTIFSQMHFIMTLGM